MDWNQMLSIALAIVVASVVNRYLFKNNPNSTPNITAQNQGNTLSPPQTVEQYVKSAYPNAWTV